MGNIYNIPADWNFTESLALGIMEISGGKTENLSAIKILLPTRRACRELRNSFLKITKGKTIILPSMYPIGDLDAEELELKIGGSGNNKEIIEIPPAISDLRRQLLLTTLIKKLPEHTGNTSQAIKLAAALCKLMDQIYAENLSLADMDKLVPEEFSEHWQITLNFLKILSTSWPEILKEHNLIDAADRRNRILKAQSDFWKENPPTTPIIAAGSTGTIPAVSNLLKTISSLPEGMVIIPGLDDNIDDESWQFLEPTHPQYAIKNLLNHIGIDKEEVKIWKYEAQELNQNWHKQYNKQFHKILASEIMRPSQTIDKWKDINIANIKEHIKRKDILKIECENEQDEATLISMLMREALEDPDKICALVTPDRFLARRVAASLKRWNINIDDSGGYNLSDSLIGSYLRLILQALLEEFTPSTLLPLLKHKITSGLNISKNFRSDIRLLEKYLLRGKAPQEKGINGLIKHLEQKKLDKYAPLTESIACHIEEFLQQLEPIFEQNRFIIDSPKPLESWIESHIKIAEDLATTHDQSGAERLWSGDAGQAASLFFTQLIEESENLPNVTAKEYFDIIQTLMKNIMVRPKYGTHPRLIIIGLMESRLYHADRMILAGLNENTWPPEPSPDPWMSRPMKKEYNLPPPERVIGTAAHDFVSCFCAKEIFLTRSKRQGDAPSVPSRWLQRLDTVIKAAGIDPEIINSNYHKKLLSYLTSNNKDIQPAQRPAPCPPVKNRPKKLSVTQIEKWMIDPYSIYAKHILKLNCLDEIEKESDASELGNVTHEILERFITANKTTLPDNSIEIMKNIAFEILGNKLFEKSKWIFWKQRFDIMALWFTENEKKRREKHTPLLLEQKGSIMVGHDTAKITLTARTDRIDLSVDGYLSIIDYKTGTPPKKPEITSGRKPQLPLTGLIVEKGGFKEIHDTKIASLEIWEVSGKGNGGDIISIDNEKNDNEVQELILDAKEALETLVTKFANEQTPYYATPNLSSIKTNDYLEYNHLARTKEWADISGDMS